MSPDPVLAAIDDTLEAVRPQVCACGCDAPIGPGSKSMYYATESCQHRWMERGKRTTATGPGWVSPPNVRYAQDNRCRDCQRIIGDAGEVCGSCIVIARLWPGPQNRATQEAGPCEVRCGHGLRCLGWTDSPGHWYLCDSCTPAPAGFHLVHRTVSDDVASHRPATPLQIIWRALAKRRHP